MCYKVQWWRSRYNSGDGKQQPGDGLRLIGQPSDLPQSIVGSGRFENHCASEKEAHRFQCHLRLNPLHQRLPLRSALTARRKVRPCTTNPLWICQSLSHEGLDKSLLRVII
jgi:hypothetical protein